MTIGIGELILRLATSSPPGQRDRLRTRDARTAGGAADPPSGITGFGDIHANLISIRVHPADNALGGDGLLRADVGRIASNVVVGIGFLGGGAILHSGLRIEGLTTAASLWMVAAVGLASGAGLYVLAFASAAIALFALVALRVVEVSFKSVLHLRVRIDCVGEFVSRAQLQQALGSIGAKVADVDYAHDLSADRSRTHVDVRLPRHDVEEAMVKILEELPSVQKVVRRPWV